MDGFICINKPAGMSSNDVVMNVRRFTGEKRTGHTGTLDPNACGLLTVAVGKAARLIEYMDEHPKLYRCEAVLGLSTDTHDVWGTPVCDKRGQFEMPSEDDLEHAMDMLCGQIVQVPSKYSALKVDGKRLYELAREGKDVQVKSRDIGIHWFSLIDFDPKTGVFFFDVCCSKGTYVRTLCDMIGEILGCGAAMTFLLRLNSNGYSLDDAITMEQLAAMNKDQIEESLYPCERAVDNLVSVRIKGEYRAERFLNGLEFHQGQCFWKGAMPIPGCTVSVWLENRFLGTALCELQEGQLIFKPDKVFK